MIPQPWLDALPFGVLVVDTDQRLVQINSWLAARLPEGSVEVGQPLAQAFPELAERSLLAAFDLLWHEGRPVRLPSSLYSYFLRLAPDPGADLDAMPQSVTLAPLQIDGRVAGALIVIEDVTQRVLTERQLQREIDKMTALHEVDRALATLDLQACLQTIVERSQILCCADSSVLFLCEDDRLVVAAATGSALAAVGKSMPISQGVAGWVAANRRPLLVPDVACDERYIAYDACTRSEMAVPMLLRGDCLGVINEESEQIGAFDAASVEVLEWLAARAAAAIHNARLHAAEREQRTLADNLRNIGLSLTAQLDPEAILDTLLDYVARVVPFDTACVMMLDARTSRVRIARQRGYERFGVLHLVPEFDVPLDSVPNLSLMATAMRPQVVPYTRSDPRWLRTALAAHIGSWAGAPILARGQVLGFLSLDKVEPGTYRLEMAERLAAFAAQAGLALENARLYAEQQKLAVTDSLTGLANRRYFDQELARELQRASRFNRSTALILLDPDDFKDFNDRYGHPAGDELLRSIAIVLAQSVRTIDTTARYGGDEFVLILPECDAAAACDTAERLRVLVARLPLVPGPTSSAGVTISLGVALAPLHGDSPGRLVQAADDALYAAKRSGKNRVVLYGSPDPQPQASPASTAGGHAVKDIE